MIGNAGNHAFPVFVAFLFDTAVTPCRAQQAVPLRRWSVFSVCLHPELLTEINLPHQRILQYLRRCSLGQHRSGVDNIGELANVESIAHVVVCDQNSDASGAQRFDDALDFIYRYGIDAGKGFIEQYEGRLRRQCACDFAASSVSTGSSPVRSPTIARLS